MVAMPGSSALSAGEIVDLIGSLDTDGRLVHIERLAARPPAYSIPADPLPLAVGPAVPGSGLYIHQVEMIDHLRAGRSVAVATGTASGKSLGYQIPILEAALDGHTSLLVHPTKALSQDQLRSFTALGVAGVDVAVVDGDSSPQARQWARRRARVLFTNPDMLHASLLPRHGLWADFWSRLRFVVVDELHMMRGVFGTHVAHVLRRLRRVALHHGSDPVFAFASATLGQPARLAHDLCGKPVEEITTDGSPAGERVVALWNPPVIDGDGTRRSPQTETAELVAELVRRDRRVICFVASRRGVENVSAQAAEALPGDLAGSIRPYRGGYLASERREIEAELFSGRLHAVIATSALELGIDVGALDTSVLCGFPGTIAAFWQRAGRAGRSSDASLVVLVAGSDQLDQWLMTHPRQLFVRSPEPAVINVANPHVADPHLACAAHELPLELESDGGLWGESLDDGVRRLVGDDALVLRGGRGVWAGRGTPARGIGLRSGSSDEVAIATADGTLIGTVDGGRAASQVHPGAIYLHRGDAFRVVDLDFGDHTAWVEPADGSETTYSRHTTDIAILEVECSATVGTASSHLGAVEVTQQVTGYRRVDTATGDTIGRADLDLPPTRLESRAFWYEIDPGVMERAGLHRRQWGGALHAVEHAGIGILPLFAICDRWDVGGVSMTAHPANGRPSIFIYDGYAGGSGIAELGFDAGRRHLIATLEVIEGCGCGSGCPSCVQSPKCGNGNEPLDKEAAVRVLKVCLAPA